MKKLILIILAVFCFSYSGSFVVLDNHWGVVSYGLKPSCLKTAYDTIGAMDILDGEYVSLTFNGKKMNKADTAIIDSGIIVRMFGSATTKKVDMCKMSTADSVVQFYGANDTTTTRDVGKTKGLTLDLNRYLWVVLERFDTNTDTLDFNADSTVMILNIKKSR